VVTGRGGTDGPASPLPEPAELEELEALATRVAGEAARLVVEARPDTMGVGAKSTPTDVVTEMDQRSQDLILARLTAARPHDGVHGEEEGGVTGTSGVTWLVDPIDGTVNYLYTLAPYAVSVAAVVGDATTAGGWVPVAGAVVNAATGEVFTARAGGGARLTDPAGARRPLRASGASDLARALVGTGFSYAAEVRARQGRALLHVLPRVRDIRRGGSAALDICSVAAGRLDAYYETGVQGYDMAAGLVVATEAGAVVGGLGAPGPDLTWVCAPGLAGTFPPLVEALTREHVLGG
jgi:myo-inositol-1(or 4)-monophosphatase